MAAGLGRTILMPTELSADDQSKQCQEELLLLPFSLNFDECRKKSQILLFVQDSDLLEASPGGRCWGTCQELFLLLESDGREA